jgi:hypothetical protein
LGDRRPDGDDSELIGRKDRFLNFATLTVLLSQFSRNPGRFVGPVPVHQERGQGAEKVVGVAEPCMTDRQPLPTS